MSYGTTKHQLFLSCLATNKDWSDGAHGMKPWMRGRIAMVRNSRLLATQLCCRLSAQCSFLILRTLLLQVPHGATTRAASRSTNTVLSYSGCYHV
jgi:hypothetical protein